MGKIMLQKFKTYQLAVQFHNVCKATTVPSYLRDQLLRSSSSVALNIAEGSGKLTFPDKRRFYSIALGSLRESVAALELSGHATTTANNLSDPLGACLYRLCHPK
jgi:four helix bundle protein